MDINFLGNVYYKNDEQNTPWRSKIFFSVTIHWIFLYFTQTFLTIHSTFLTHIWHVLCYCFTLPRRMGGHLNILSGAGGAYLSNYNVQVLQTLHQYHLCRVGVQHHSQGCILQGHGFGILKKIANFQVTSAYLGNGKRKSEIDQNLRTQGL